MRLRIVTPTEVLLDEEVSQVTMEAEDGSFSLLPAHIDYVATLVPGLLSYRDGNGEESVVAIDEGVVVKQGERTLVSCQQAVQGRRLEDLMQTVEEQFETRDEQEEKARTALAKMEADFVRRLLQNERYGNG